MCLCFRKHLITRTSKMWTGQKKQKPNALNQWKEDKRLLTGRENSKAAGNPHPRHYLVPPLQGLVFHLPHSLHNNQNPPHKCSGHLKTQLTRYQSLMLAWKRWRKWCHSPYRVWLWRAFKGDHWSLETLSPLEVQFGVLITNEMKKYKITTHETYEKSLLKTKHSLKKHDILLCGFSEVCTVIV